MVPADLLGLRLSSSEEEEVEEEQEGKVLYSDPFDEWGLQSNVEFLQSL